MTDINRGKLTVLRDILLDRDSEIASDSIAAVLTAVLADRPAAPEQTAPATAPATAPKQADLQRVIAYGRGLDWTGKGMQECLYQIVTHFGLRQKDFAAMIGVSPTTISCAMTGTEARRKLLTRCTELFGA